jgi:hypothetical protein
MQDIHSVARHKRANGKSSYVLNIGVMKTEKKNVLRFKASSRRQNTPVLI